MRRWRGLALVAVGLALAGCVIEFGAETDGAVIINGTGQEIHIEAVADDLDTSRVRNGKAGGTLTLPDPSECAPFDLLRFYDADPETTPDAVLLYEQDLDEQPVCNLETWVFDGERLVRDE